MKRNVFLTIALAASVFVSCGGQKESMESEHVMETAPTIELKDFFKNPEKTSYQISPDGKYYSYLAPYESRKNIHIENIESGETKRVTSQTDRDIAGYFWANNEQLVFMRDDGGDENWYLVMTSVSTGDEVPLTKMEGVRSQIIDALEDIPSQMIVGLNKRNPQFFDPYRLDLNTGEMTMIAENPGNITGWMTDHEGKLRVANTTDGVNTSILYRATENDAWKTVITTNFKEGISPSFFTFDNKNVYATSNIGRDTQAAIIFNIETGEEIEELYVNEHNDVSGISYSKKRQLITSARYTAEKSERHFFDAESEATYARLQKELAGYEVAVTSVTDEEDKYIIRTYSDRSLGA